MMSIGRKLVSWQLILLFVLVGFFLSACTSLIRPNYTQELMELRSGQYQLDPDHVYVHFKVEHLGLSTVVGRFNSVDASLDFDPENMDGLRLDGVVDVASIDLNNESLENQLQGGGWFDADQFPQALFNTMAVEAGEEGRFNLMGELTIKGVTKPVTLSATFKGGADNMLTGKYTLGFAAQTSFKRSDFGIDALSGLVADVVFVEIHAEFQRSTP